MPLPRKPDVDFTALKDLLRRIFGPDHPVSFERTADGVACQVYRLRRDGVTSYLRVAEEADEDLGMDALVLQHLRGLGVRVPEVLHVETFDQALQRSVLVMSEISGAPLTQVTDPVVAGEVARAAGRDAALLNSITMEGFAWMERDRPSWPPRGELASHAEFVRSYLPADGDPRVGLLSRLFDAAQLDTLERLIEAESTRGVQGARLAHGDLDASPIMCADGRYSGLIDFSELRGAEPEFDLGHFTLHDGETNPLPLVEHFRAGYADVAPDLAGDAEQIRRSAILLGLRQLCIWLSPRRGMTPEDFWCRFRAAQLANLIEGRPAATPRNER